MSLLSGRSAKCKMDGEGTGPQVRRSPRLLLPHWQRPGGQQGGRRKARDSFPSALSQIRAISTYLELGVPAAGGHHRVLPRPAPGPLASLPVLHLLLVFPKENHQSGSQNLPPRRTPRLPTARRLCPARCRRECRWAEPDLLLCRNICTRICFISIG